MIMVSKCVYVGKSKTVQSVKDGKEYDILLFDDNKGHISEVAVEKGTFKKSPSDTYFINSYKSSDGYWKHRLMTIE